MKTRDVWCLALLAGMFFPVGYSWGIEIDVTQPPYNAIPDDGISDRAAIDALSARDFPFKSPSSSTTRVLGLT